MQNPISEMNSLPFILCLSLVTACQGDDAQLSGGNGANAENEGEVRYLKRASNSSRPNGDDSLPRGLNEQVQVRRKTELEFKPVRDSKTGRITSYLPLPVDWKINPPGSGQPFIQGPDGITVTANPAEQYYYHVADPQVAQMAGMALAEVVPVETIFREKVVPAIQHLGGKLLKEYPLPEIAERSQQILQTVLTRGRINSVKLHASEWQQSDGKKSLILLSQVDMSSQGAGSWWVSLTEVEALAHFAQAKQTYLFAQANFQPDQQTANAHAANLNRQERESQEVINRSWSAHNAEGCICWLRSQSLAPQQYTLLR